MYVANQLIPLTRGWKTEPAPVPTDHWLVSVKYAPKEAPMIGKGRWTMPLQIRYFPSIFHTGRHAVWVRGSQVAHAHLRSGTHAGASCCPRLCHVAVSCRIAFAVSLCHVALVASLCRASLTFITLPSCSAFPQCTMVSEFFAYFRVLLLTLPTAGGFFAFRLINPLAIANYCFPSRCSTPSPLLQT
jgi:hypothetical protein